MTKLAMKFLPIIFLSLLLITMASAEFVVVESDFQDPVFSTHSSSLVSLCACGSTIDYVVITNTNIYSQSFTLYSDSDFLSLSSDSIIVGPHSSLSVPYKITVPCDAKDSSFEIYVKGLLETQMVSKDLSVSSCQNLKVEIKEQNMVVPICEPFVSSFRIENTGTFLETYTVEADNYKDYTSSQSQEVIIPANAYADVAFIYQFDCGMIGNYALEYDVYSQKSRMKVDVLQNISINDSYDYSIQLSEVSNTCLNDESYFEIIIENKNNFTDFFRVDSSAPNYVNIQFPEFEGKITKTIALNAFSKTTLGVVVSPTKERHIGSDDIIIFVSSKYAKSKQLAKTNISIFDCYNFDGFFSSSPNKVYACGDETFTNNVELFHSGHGSPSVDFVSSHDFVSIENNFLSFNGQEQKNISLNFAIPNNVTSKDKVIISALFRNETVDTVSFDLFMDTKENCYMLSPVKNKVSLFEDSEYFSFSVQNVGDRNALYSSTLVNAPTYLELLSGDFDVESGRRSNILFQMDRGILFQDANNYNNGSIIGLNSNISINFNNLDSDVVYGYDFEIEFIDYPWYVKAWQVSKTLSPCLVSFFVLSLLVILFGVIGLIKTYRHEHFSSNGLLAIIFLVLFIVATIFVVSSFGIPKSPYTSHDLDSNSSTVIRMLEDKSKTIDLKTFFFDPDDNLINFGVANYDSALLSISEDNSLVTLNPRSDWYGNTTIALFVEDTYNESALSPDIVVEILSVEDYSFFELFMMFCVYFNLVVLLFLFVVVYVSFSFHPKPKEQQLTLTDNLDGKNETKSPASKKLVKTKNKKANNISKKSSKSKSSKKSKKSSK